MEFDKESFAAYFKRHKLACKAIVDAYIAEHPQETYHYEDIDAVYQRQVEQTIGDHHISSRARMHNARAGGGTCTMSGMKYGHSHQ